MRLFLTGTDTGVGKTHIAVLLIRALRKAGRNAVGLKPICCGGREDAEALCAAADAVLPLNEINPVWLRPAAAPYVASIIESRSIDLALVHNVWSRIAPRFECVIIEGVGGWRVPIARDYFVGDLAAEFGLPVAVVVANRLGAINHTLLTVESIRARGLPIAGLILNHVTAPSPEDALALSTNRTVLEELTRLPVLAEIEHGQQSLARFGDALLV